MNGMSNMSMIHTAFLNRFTGNANNFIFVKFTEKEEKKSDSNRLCSPNTRSKLMADDRKRESDTADQQQKNGR